MKKIGFILFALFFGGMIAYGQIDKMKDVLDDEMDTEHFTLRFFNALDGTPIQDATVEIDDVGKFKTDVEGKVRFPKMKDGEIAVHFRADGYIPTDLPVEIVAGSIFNNRISVSPEMAIEYFRIVLDWKRYPRDLDAHFVKDGGYHISFRNMKASRNDVARLDRDDTDGFGPETITVKKINSGDHYVYYVRDYTNRNDDNSKALSRSGATVKIYGDGRLMDVVTVPQGKHGNKWTVFEIVNGKVNLIDNMPQDH